MNSSKMSNRRFTRIVVVAAIAAMCLAVATALVSKVPNSDTGEQQAASSSAPLDIASGQAAETGKTPQAVQKAKATAGLGKKSGTAESVGEPSATAEEIPANTAPVETKDAADSIEDAEDTPDARQSMALESVGPPANAHDTGTGNASEVSLADAAGVPAGPASAQDGPDRSAGLTERGPIDPADVLGDEDALPLGGCLAEYGETGQCLPFVPPSMAGHVQEMKDAGMDPSSMQHRWACAEVTTYFPDGLQVRKVGADPQGLDINGDGTACGAGD